MDPTIASVLSRSVVRMPEDRRAVTAAELEAMPPLERAALIDAATVTDWADGPPAFRGSVDERARTAAGRLRSAER